MPRFVFLRHQRNPGDIGARRVISALALGGNRGPFTRDTQQFAQMRQAIFGVIAPSAQRAEPARAIGARHARNDDGAHKTLEHIDGA